MVFGTSKWWFNSQIYDLAVYGDLSVASERDLVAVTVLLVAASLLPVAGSEHAPRHLLCDIAAAHDILPTHGAARHCGLLAAEVTYGVPVAALPDPGRRLMCEENIFN